MSSAAWHAHLVTQRHLDWQSALGVGGGGCDEASLGLSGSVFTVEEGRKDNDDSLFIYNCGKTNKAAEK